MKQDISEEDRRKYISQADRGLDIANAVTDEDRDAANAFGTAHSAAHNLFNKSHYAALMAKDAVAYQVKLDAARKVFDAYTANNRPNEIEEQQNDK